MAKRHGNLFPLICAPENVFAAYKKARRGKSQMMNVRRFEQDLSNNLEAISALLMNQTFTTARYHKTTIFEPKKRDIYVLPFAPDRIVQHALMNIVAPIWEAMFIADSYACRVGKGIHAGSRRTMEFVRRFKYCLKADVSKFYQSVHHDTLFELVARKIKCRDTLWLLRDIIYSIAGGRNVPIGNYTSQWFGNLYLNELDQFVKHERKLRGYVRYCDDFCLFHDDKGLLRELARVIPEFLSDRLKLSLRICEVFPVTQGVDFLGYRHFPDYVLVRKSTAKRMRQRLRSLPQLLSRGAMSIDTFRSVIASIRGWLQWANTRHLIIAVDLDRIEDLAHAA